MLCDGVVCDEKDRGRGQRLITSLHAGARSSHYSCHALPYRAVSWDRGKTLRVKLMWQTAVHTSKNVPSCRLIFEDIEIKKIFKCNVFRNIFTYIISNWYLGAVNDRLKLYLKYVPATLSLRLSDRILRIDRPIKCMPIYNCSLYLELDTFLPLPHSHNIIIGWFRVCNQSHFSCVLVWEVNLILVTNAKHCTWRHNVPKGTSGFDILTQLFMAC